MTNVRWDSYDKDHILLLDNNGAIADIRIYDEQRESLAANLLYALPQLCEAAQIIAKVIRLAYQTEDRRAENTTKETA